MWKALQSSRRSGSDDEAGIESEMLKVEASMSQTNKTLERINQLAEKRLVKVRTWTQVEPVLEGPQKCHNGGQYNIICTAAEDMHSCAVKCVRL